MVVMGFHKSSGIKPGKCFPSAYQAPGPRTCLSSLQLGSLQVRALLTSAHWPTINWLMLNPLPGLYRADLGLHCACSKPGNICLDWAGKRRGSNNLSCSDFISHSFQAPWTTSRKSGLLSLVQYEPQGLMCSCALPPATSLGLSLPISNI